MFVDIANGVSGLSAKEVNDRIEKGLQNKPSTTKTKKITEILLENILSVFNVIIACVVLFLISFYFIKDDTRLLLDSIGVSLVAIINTLIAIIQEIRAKRALDKANLLLKHPVKVIRDGFEQEIEPSDIVVGDIILLERGDQIVVDGTILAAHKLEIDESLLTGESNPINKEPDDSLLSGSFCLSGNGIYRAEKVGDESYAQEITKLAKRFKLTLSPLQVRLNFIVKLLFLVAIFLVILEIIFNQNGLDNIDFIRKISTIILSLIPQGLVLMASVTFALGVYRISRIGAIIQKLNAIESFSNVQIVCIDKTGTLTQNKLAIHDVLPLNHYYTLDNIKELLGTYAQFSSYQNATIRALGVFSPFNACAIDEIPFNSDTKMSLLQLTLNKTQTLNLVLGGYDVLIHHVNKSDQDKANNLFQSRDLRVYRNLLFGIETSGRSPAEIKSNLKEITIEPLCIVSIVDQVRGDVMQAINLFHDNDIEIKILSGDSAFAIQAVAHDIGWQIQDGELISGYELDEINDDILFSLIKQKKIFARLKPEHKLRIIKILRKNHIYTAMIGDGVNDLPAIKEADMGIAMEEGSSITKEIADIILLKNKFSILPKIFEEGNKIINTVSSVSKLFLTKNFLVIYLTLTSLFLYFEFPLTPRRVSLINIFSIALPAFIIALKNSNISKVTNFTTETISFVLISASIVTIASYVGQITMESYYPGYTEEQLQMVMLSIIIIITTANFLSVTLHKGEKNLRFYLCYTFGLISLYAFLAITRLDITVINWMKIFYEISYLSSEYWLLVILIGFISAGLLFILQIFRSYFMVQLQKESIYLHKQR